jgi:hypothetical protein
MDLPILAAPWLISGLASLFGRSRLSNVIPPVANVAISNVPGIQTQLYFAGAKVVSYYPVSIPAHGVALNVTVQSYNGRLDYGLIACSRAVPDINDLGELVLAEHRLLLELALKQQEKMQQEKVQQEKLQQEKPIATKPAVKRVSTTKPKPLAKNSKQKISG